MASKDDSPTSLHGQPWSVWADRLGRDSPLSDTDEQSKVKQTKGGDAMKLPKQDMSFYGLCPVRDEFYLVTCNYCQRVCTPQGLRNHMELKHAQEWSSSCQPQLPESVDSHPSATVPVNSSAKTKAAAAAAAAAAKKTALPTSLAYLLATPAKPSRPNKRLNSGSGGGSGGSVKPATPYDKIPSPQQPPAVQFSPLQPTLTAPSPVSPLTGQQASGVLTPSPAITMTVAVDSSGNQTVQIHLPEIGNGVMLADSPAPADLAGSSSAMNRTTTTATTTLPASSSSSATVSSAAAASSASKKQRKSSKSERRMLPVKERELDLEKHCGVWIGDFQRACTRSLTCKAHSLTLRRAVQGRSRSFDDLLAEHRAVKELVLKQLKDGGGAAASLPAGAALQPQISANNKVAPTPTPTPVCPASSAVPKLGRPPLPRAPPAKKLLTTLLQQQQQPQQQQQQQSIGTGGNELSVEVPAADSKHQPTLPPSSGLLQRVFPLTFTPHHPKPLAVCSFGLRRRPATRSVVAAASSSSSSDRKWDFIRSTLRSTFQRSATFRNPANCASSGLASLLHPPMLGRQQQQHLGVNNSIELPNGLQLSIGVGQPEGHNLHHHRVRFKKARLNGGGGGGGGELDGDPSDDLMEGFDGLVGQDGVLTFLNQSNDGTASSLSLMADLSAGNITFSELNHPAGSAGGANGQQRLSKKSADLM